MIDKSEGKINEIVHLYTHYNKSTDVIYLTITELFHLLRKIVKTNETTSSIHITPFYINEKLNLQEEFDIAHLYIESRDNVSLIEKNEFAKKNMFWLSPESDYKILSRYISLDDMNSTHFLVEKTNILDFQESLNTYMLFLMDTGIPKMMKWLYDMYELDIETLPYGYFCFEVLSK